MSLKDALVSAKLRMLLRAEMAQEQFEDSTQTDDDAVQYTDTMWDAATTLVYDVLDLLADDLEFATLDELMAANAQDEDEDGMVNE